MKNLIIKELQQSIEVELNKIAQNFNEYDDMTAGMALSMEFFRYNEFAKVEYIKSRHELGLTKEEIEKAIDESVSKVLRKYLEL